MQSLATDKTSQGYQNIETKNLLIYKHVETTLLVMIVHYYSIQLTFMPDAVLLI